MAHSTSGAYFLPVAFSQKKIHIWVRIATSILMQLKATHATNKQTKTKLSDNGTNPHPQTSLLTCEFSGKRETASWLAPTRVNTLWYCQIFIIFWWYIYQYIMIYINISIRHITLSCLYTDWSLREWSHYGNVTDLDRRGWLFCYGTIHLLKKLLRQAKKRKHYPRCKWRNGPVIRSHLGSARWD